MVMNGAAGGLMLDGEVAYSYLVIARHTGRFILVNDSLRAALTANCNTLTDCSCGWTSSS